MVEKISAVTLRVMNMPTSVHFYKDILGLEIIYIFHVAPHKSWGHDSQPRTW
jgi:catechol 2,3-dioxygenase-like lactoylglutathione lyase family enzyme